VRRLARLALAVWLAIGSATTAFAQARPAAYSEFDTSIAPGDGAALQRAIARKTANYLYLQPGIYELENPVEIDRATPLFVHGADRMTVQLIAMDPSKPLFVVKRAPRLNFASLYFQPSRNWRSTRDAIAVATANSEPTELEIQDSFVDSSMLSFAGPGRYRVQNCAITPGGQARAAVWIDHPGADVLIFGGDITNGREALRAKSYAHLWQKRGRLRIYATTVEGNLGTADIQIESRSGFGPHVIAGVRSEGANGALNHKGISRLLYVPPTSEAVDVVVKSSGGAWLTGPESRDAKVRMNCKLVSYNGTGKLWLFGNRGESCIRNLVEGDAPQALIVSLGNQIGSPDPFAIHPGRLIRALDGFSHMDWAGTQEFPASRWIPDGAQPQRLDPNASVPLPPNDELPPALGRPVADVPLPGLLNVQAKPFLARGDGATDDTAAIQRALDAQCNGSTPKLLYFPAGTYRITTTLYLNHHSSACRGRLPNGGWIAGAGSARTILEMAPGVQKGVFETEGLAFATVQGITFKTWRWQPGGPQQPNVALEMRGEPGYVATQQNSLYDTVFDGGYAAFATGVRPPTGGQCSSTAAFQSKFQNAAMGFVSGHYNAIANVAYDAEFTDNDYAIASWTTDEAHMPPGGTFEAFRAVSRGTRKKDFLLRGSASGTTWYFYGWDSDAPAYVTEIGPTATAIPVLLERANLAPRVPAPNAFDIATAQGPMFLYSRVVGAGIRVGGSGSAQGYAISIASDIPDFRKTEVRTNGAIEEVRSPDRPR
jgi:hypothetical protein